MLRCKFGGEVGCCACTRPPPCPSDCDDRTLPTLMDVLESDVLTGNEEAGGVQDAGWAPVRP